MTDAGETSFDLETTVPTDLTVSSFSDLNVKKKSSRKPADGYLKERKEYIRELQLLNIELTRKNSQIESLQTELNIKTKKLEEKLKDCVHQKQLMHAKLVTQVKLSGEEANRKITLIQNELKNVKQENKQWDELSANLKHSLNNLTFSDIDYAKLRVLPTDSLDLPDYVVLKVYEHTWNFKKENEELKSRAFKLQEQLSTVQAQLKFYQEAQGTIKEESYELKEKVKDLNSQVTLLKSRIEHGNYAHENFSRVKSERDLMQNELIVMKKNVSALKVEMLQMTQEKESTKEELRNMKHSYDLLQKECDTLSRQLSDVTQRWGESQDEAVRVKSELDHEKTSREELLQSFVSLRERLKVDYEDRLVKETNRTKTSITELYENKIRELNEGKNASLRQKESAEKATMELKRKYEELYKKFHENSVAESDKVKKLQQELEELKAEHQKILLNLKNLQVNYREKCLECDKIAVKLQLTEQELDTLRKSTSERLQQLETELGTNKARLEMFEKMESELNEVVSEAAQVEDSTDQVLDIIADQICLPAKARYSFVKSVHLTRKVMQLERAVHTHEENLVEEKHKNEKLSEELSQANHLLEQVNQPYAYLISAVRENESTIRNMKQKLSKLENELDVTLKEKKAALDERNNLASDLEKLLENREEIAKIRQQLTVLQSQHNKKTLHHTSLGAMKKNEAQKKQVKPKWK